jgi:hypothetical protein
MVEWALLTGLANAVKLVHQKVCGERSVLVPNHSFPYTLLPESVGPHLVWSTNLICTTVYRVTSGSAQDALSLPDLGATVQQIQFTFAVYGVKGNSDAHFILFGSSTRENLY